MAVPSRRMLIVLSTLIGSMTLTSSLLLLLFPGPVAPLSGIQFWSIDTRAQPQKLLFPGTPQTGSWTSISVCWSGQTRGSAKSLNKLHERLGYGGLLHHFVISNGRGAPDGQIAIGFRWRYQDHLSVPEASGGGAPPAEQQVSICLVGDGGRQGPTESQIRELVWLVRQLQYRFQIPGTHVDLATEDLALFPVASFRQQLLRP